MRGTLALSLLLASTSAFALTRGAGVTIPPVVISSVSSGTPTSTGATITWTNTPAANGQVCYGPTTAYGTCTTRDASPVTSDTATLAGLASSTLYHYQANATAAGFSQGFSPDQTFTTAALPTVVISGISSGTPTSTGATITWTNAPSANGQVCYGPTTAYGTCTTRDSSPLTSDMASISGLASSTLYHYQANATAAGYLQGFSPDGTFTTASAGGTCPQGSALPDGCPGAPALTNQGTFGTYTNAASTSFPNVHPPGTWMASGFFTTNCAAPSATTGIEPTMCARQSGQTYATRPTWNVAGVDYPVGINYSDLVAAPFSGGLVDPALYWSTSGSSLARPGCTWTAGTSTLNCIITTGGDLNIYGIDYSLHPGTIVKMSNNQGACNLYDSYIFPPTSAFSGGFINIGAICTGGSSIHNNVMDGNSWTLNGQMLGTVTPQAGAWLNGGVPNATFVVNSWSYGHLYTGQNFGAASYNSSDAGWVSTANAQTTGTSCTGTACNGGSWTLAPWGADIVGTCSGSAITVASHTGSSIAPALNGYGATVYWSGGNGSVSVNLAGTVITTSGTCTGATDFTLFYPSITSTSTATNFFAMSSQTPAALITYAGKFNMPFSFTYNAIFQPNMRIGNSTLVGTFTQEFNYVEDLMVGNALHGEQFFAGGASSIVIDYNTALGTGNAINPSNTAIHSPYEGNYLGVNTTTTSATTGTNVLPVASTTSVVVGISAYDFTTPSAIPVGTLVASIAGLNVTLSNTVTGAGNGDLIRFGSTVNYDQSYNTNIQNTGLNGGQNANGFNGFYVNGRSDLGTPTVLGSFQTAHNYLDNIGLLTASCGSQAVMASVSAPAANPGDVDLRLGGAITGYVGGNSISKAMGATPYVTFWPLPAYACH